jgi:hypothetical protein
LLADVPRLEALATKLCIEYTEAKNYGARKKWLKHAAVEIEVVDSQIIMSKRLPEIICGVIYRSYCSGDNSVEVAQALGLKPPAVRQLLSRLSKVWKKMQTEDAAPTVAGHLWKTPRHKLAQRGAARAKRHALLMPAENSARLLAASTKASTWFANLTPEALSARRLRNATREKAKRNARRERVTATG